MVIVSINANYGTGTQTSIRADGSIAARVSQMPPRRSGAQAIAIDSARGRQVRVCVPSLRLDVRGYHHRRHSGTQADVASARLKLSLDSASLRPGAPAARRCAPPSGLNRTKAPFVTSPWFARIRARFRQGFVIRRAGGKDNPCQGICAPAYQCVHPRLPASLWPPCRELACIDRGWPDP